jgi:cyclophilin family peptidyl-prolyl cis-trans isomerase
MARRERERYTERSRPYRREPGQAPSGGSGGSGGGSTGNGQGALRNPAVMVAVGALILALVLAFGIWLGRKPATETAVGGTPTAQATGAATLAVETPAGAAPTAGPTTQSGNATPAAAAAGAAAAKKTYSAPVDQKLDPAGKSYFATIDTAKGPIELELWPDLAPKHVNSFVFLAREGFFDGLTFHRVVDNFVIQGGDPTGSGNGGPGYSLPGEFHADNPVPHRAGTLAMARTSDPNSAGSQFYIVTTDGAGPTQLNGQYTVFGHVVKGMDVVKTIKQGDVMNKVTITEKPKSASVVSPDDIRQGKLPQNN